MSRYKNYIFIGLLFFAGSFLVHLLTTIYPNILWFQAAGYFQQWWFAFSAKLKVFGLFSLMAFAWLSINYWIAQKISNSSDAAPRQFNTPFGLLNQILGDLAAYSLHRSQNSINRGSKNILSRVGIIALSLILGLSAKGWWESLYTYVYQVPFGVADPIFGKDISYYLFTVPFFTHLQGWFMSLLVVSLLVIGWVYFSKNILLLLFSSAERRHPLKPHFFCLMALMALLLSVSAWFDMYNLLLSSEGSVFGAGYTDIAVRLWYIKGMVVLWAIQALLFVLAAFRLSAYAPVTFLGVILVFSLGVGRFLPSTIQAYNVAPNELEKETPYINHHIFFTRLAYQLENITEEDFPANNNLTMRDLEKNDDTIRNIRLWNSEPIKQTFSQLQEIRLYYEFLNVDVDRYMINGKLQQVMLSPRELDTNQLTKEAQNWINRHIVYTHGYGLCLSPVNEVTSEGLPHFYIKDLPPVSSIDLEITRPEIYFGEKSAEYVLVNTKEQEFDYPKGDTNIYAHYQGKGGVQLNSFFKKMVFALKYSDSKLIFNQDIIPSSRIIFDRQIELIVQKIAPFLVLETDPYLVITKNGRLVWMMDGFTLSNQFPYSQPYNKSINYIRNSVKITLDAYDGKVNFYITDNKDPIIATYARLYKNLFKPFNEMPDDFKHHMRYPKSLFNVQSTMYKTYHMTDTKVFYNKEDVWALPFESADGKDQAMDSYYLVTKLPGDKDASFILMQPYTPANKNNMIAWMSVKCDLNDYGNIKVFKFPKERTIYGPMQIESRINQDTEISQNLTLWDQAGSRVIRGNLMVIPIEDSLIYAEPIYLQAIQGKLPELKRVIFAYKDKVVMDQTLTDAIEKTFDDNYQKPIGKVELPVSKTSPEKNLIKALSDEYNNLRDAARTNWQSFGNSLDRLGEIIEELKEAEPTTSQNASQN